MASTASTASTAIMGSMEVTEHTNAKRSVTLHPSTQIMEIMPLPHMPSTATTQGLQSQSQLLQQEGMEIMEVSISILHFPSRLSS